MPYRLHHVQLGLPTGREDDARAFYAGLLGLREVDKPPVLKERGGVWFELDGAQLHLGVEPGFRPATKAHPALEVAEWEELRNRLRGAGRPVEDEALLPGRRRFYTSDPFGNRLEFVDRASG